MGSADADSDTSDDESSAECFRIVRRSRGPSKKPRPGTDQEGAGAGAVYMPDPILAALSPDPPPSPMSDDDTQSQPLPPGTDQEGGAGAVDAPMAIMEWRAPDPPPPPPPRSESGAYRRRQRLPTRRPNQPTSRARRPGALSLRPPYTVESIFTNFIKRRGAFIRALTTDEEALFQKCDPGMEPLHLYGGTDGNWEVKPPGLELQTPEPEPTPGINILRDTMERKKWLLHVALHSDAWLINISRYDASYIAAEERGRLFTMITGLPTVKEILLARVEEEMSSGPEDNEVVEEEKGERSSGPNEANEVEGEKEVYIVGEQGSSGPTEGNEVLEEAEEDTTSDDNNCASCQGRYNTKAFWIGCDECNKWYHGKCVKIKSSEAEHMKRYECPDCYKERVRWSS